MFCLPVYTLTVAVTLKSGVTIKIRCDEFTFTKQSDDSLSGYNFKNVAPGDLKYLCLAEVAFVSYKKN